MCSNDFAPDCSLISIFNWLRDCLNLRQSEASLDFDAFNLGMSMSCIRFFNSGVIHGDLNARVRLTRSGACLSKHCKNIAFQASHIALGSTQFSMLLQF